MTITYSHNVLPDAEGIPSFPPTLFENEYQSARFAVGIVAIGSEVLHGLENEFDGYALERTRRYLAENYITEADLNSDGTELDEEDNRAVHFTVVENMVDYARTAGTMRLIIKSGLKNSLLPIESMYPEAFDNPAQVGSVESSRVSANRTLLTKLLFASGVNYVQHHRLGPVYGVVKPDFEQALNRNGISVLPLADPKYVPEINAIKQPILVDLPRVESNFLVSDQAALFEEMRRLDGGFVYSGRVNPRLLKRSEPDQ